MMWLWNFFNPQPKTSSPEEESTSLIRPNWPFNGNYKFPLEEVIEKEFKRFLELYCNDDALKRTNSFLMGFNIWHLYDTIMFLIAKEQTTVNTTELVQHNIFTKEIETLDLKLPKEESIVTALPASRPEYKFGVSFYITEAERLKIVKNYLEERVQGLSV